MSTKPITTNEALNMMLSVSEITFELYPNDNKLDDDFIKNILSPYLKNHKTDDDILITRDTLLLLLDQAYGDLKNWYGKLDDNNIRIDMNNIIESIQDCLAVFTSVETVLYLDTFPNVVYFRIHINQDSTSQHIINTTVYNIPDTSISKLSINLRDLLPQHIVDKINEYLIKRDFLSNSILDKTHAFSIKPLSAWLNNVLADVIDELKTQDDINLIYNSFSFLNIPELENTTLDIVTDYNIV